VDLYSALRIITFNVLPLPVNQRWSASQPYSQAFSEHCETTDTGRCITRYARLLAQLTPGTHSSLSGPGCLVPRQSGLPVQRRSPT